MKSDFFRLAVAVCTAVVSSVSAIAQEVTMRVDLVAWGDPISGLVVGGGGGKPVTAQPFRYSKGVTYSGSTVMEIHQAAGEATAPAALEPAEAEKLPAALKQVLERRKTSPTLVALAALPSGSKRATVLMMPAPGGIYLTYVLDDDPSKLPVGRLRVHNLSPHPLMLRFNEKESRQVPMHGSCTATPVNQELVYELAYEQENEEKQKEWKMLENNLVSVAEDEQTQMIVLKSDSEYFVSSNGSRSGYLQVVFLRRSPKEAEIVEISKAEREAAEREAKRLNDEMDEAAKPEAQRRKTKPPGK